MPASDERLREIIREELGAHRPDLGTLPMQKVASWLETNAEQRATDALIARSVGANEMAPPQKWIPATFQNNWVNYSANYTQAAFYKDHLGMVHLRGLIKSGTIGLTAFTLPVGYRPTDITSTAQLIIPTVSNDAFGKLLITADGKVDPSIGSNVWFSLDGVHFRCQTGEEGPS